jgi:ATP-dependent DNA helicase RecG
MIEQQNTEWKSSWRDEYLKWVCGFANAEGGVLEIGREDDGNVLGLREVEKLLVDIPNKVLSVLGIMVDVNLHSEAGKDFIRIVVEPYPYPISYKGDYFYRSGATNQELKGTALDKFLLAKQGKRWDGVPVPNVKIEDLSKSAINLFRTLAKDSGRLGGVVLKESFSQLLEKLHLLDGKYLKRAATLLFHPDPERFVTGAFVKIGFFHRNSELLYHDEVHGDLFSQVNKTLELLQTKYLKAGIVYRGIQRIERFPVPDFALREAILNAIVHKDYSSGTPVQISVYHDKLMIWNPGELPDNWTIGKLKEKHPSRPFNPDIANAFFRSGMIEAWGRGIERIIEACHEENAPEPNITNESDGLWIEFNFSEEYLGLLKEGTTPKTTPESSYTTQETTQENGATTQEIIFALIKSKPTITRVELAKIVGISSSGVRYHLDRLKEAGKIKHSGPTKGGRWEIINE